MLNISREYRHNLNTAVVFLKLYQHIRLQLQWILHREWDLRAIPFGALFCRLSNCYKSSLLCSWSLRPCLPSPGGNTIRCRGHFIQCHCLSTAVIRKKRWSCPSGENSGLLGNIKKQGRKRERNREENSGEMSTKTGTPELLSEEIQPWPLMGDNIEQNMYWRQRLCLLPVPFQWITPLHPLPPAF